MMRGHTVMCGAKTRRGTCCGNIPMKNGRCRMHGGKSTGPRDITKLKGNQNAVGNKARLTTGEYETITWNTLTEFEREYLQKQYNLKPNERMESAFEMEIIRQARMFEKANCWDVDVQQNFDEILHLEDAMSRVSYRIVKMALSMSALNVR